MPDRIVRGRPLYGPRTDNPWAFEASEAKKARPVESGVRRRAVVRPELTCKQLIGNELRWLSARSALALNELRQVFIKDALWDADNCLGRDRINNPQTHRKLLAVLMAEGEILAGLDEELEAVVAGAAGAVREVMLKRLLEYVTQDGRICPMPQQWMELFRMLGRARGYDVGLVLGREGAEIGLSAPLILAAWDSPGLLKIMRLQEHIQFAAENNALPEVDEFLRSLERREWFPEVDEAAPEISVR